jgi:hypothetical protein
MSIFDRFLAVVIGLVAILTLWVTLRHEQEHRDDLMQEIVLISVWVALLGLVAWSAYRNITESKLAESRQATVDNASAQEIVDLKAEKRRLAGEVADLTATVNGEQRENRRLRDVIQQNVAYSNGQAAELAELESYRRAEAERREIDAKISNGPRLWLAYKTKATTPPGLEKLIFGRDGTQPVTNIQVGPLVWSATRKLDIVTHNVIGELRDEPIECRITASTTEGNLTQLHDIPDYYREMIRQFGSDSALMDVTYEAGNVGFRATFRPSIDPYDRIVLEQVKIQVLPPVKEAT